EAISLASPNSLTANDYSLTAGHSTMSPFSSLAARARSAEAGHGGEEIAAAVPSTNGDDGSARASDDDRRPSTNGDDGDGVLKVFWSGLRGGGNGSDGDPRT